MDELRQDKIQDMVDGLKEIDNNDEDRPLPNTLPEERYWWILNDKS